MIARIISGNGTRRNDVNEIKEILHAQEKHLGMMVALLRGDPFSRSEDIKVEQVVKAEKNITAGVENVDPEAIERRINMWCRCIFFGLYLVSILLLFYVFL